MGRVCRLLYDDAEVDDEEGGITLGVNGGRSWNVYGLFINCDIILSTLSH